jgi:hypothetical protein
MSERELASACVDWFTKVEANTSLVGFDHQLIDRFELRVVELAHLLLFDIWYVGRACVLEVLECL